MPTDNSFGIDKANNRHTDQELNRVTGAMMAEAEAARAPVAPKPVAPAPAPKVDDGNAKPTASAKF